MIHLLWSETKILHSCVMWFPLCSLSGLRNSTAVRNAVCHEARDTAPFPPTNPWILHCTNPNLFCWYSLLHLSQLTGSAQQKLSQGHVRKPLSENARTDQFCVSVYKTHCAHIMSYYWFLTSLALSNANLTTM